MKYNKSCIGTEQTKAILTYLQRFDKNTKICDLGCGAGFFMAELEINGFKKISGVDISDHRIVAKEYTFTEINLNQSNNIPVNDVFIATEVLEHLDNMRQILTDICVKHKDSVLIASIPNISYIGYRIQFLLTGDNLLARKDNDHYNNITQQLIEKVCHELNLSCEILPYKCTLPFIRKPIPYVPILATNTIYIIKVIK